MAITYKLNGHRVSFHWDKNSNLWTARSEDLNGLNLQSKSFSSMLKMLNNQQPKLAHSIRIFFPDSVKEVAELHYPRAFSTSNLKRLLLDLAS
ncbi:MAG: DUF1902 domain-containing protein [Gammaproteobacteria bacterium]